VVFFDPGSSKPSTMYQAVLGAPRPTCAGAGAGVAPQNAVSTKLNCEMCKQSWEYQFAADTMDMDVTIPAKAASEEAKASAEGELAEPVIEARTFASAEGELAEPVKELANSSGSSQSALGTASPDCMRPAADHVAASKARTVAFAVGELAEPFKELANSSGSSKSAVAAVSPGCMRPATVHEAASLASSTGEEPGEVATLALQRLQAAVLAAKANRVQGGCLVGQILQQLTRDDFVSLFGTMPPGSDEAAALAEVLRGTSESSD